MIKWIPVLVVCSSMTVFAQCKDTLGYLDAKIPSVADDQLSDLRQKILGTSIKDVVEQIRQQNLSLRDGAKALMSNADQFDDALGKAAQDIKELGGNRSDKILADLKQRRYDGYFPAGESALGAAIRQYVLTDWGQLSMRESAVQLLCLARKEK